MIKLSKTEVEDYIYSNKYLPAKDSRLLSRCIDGRYPNSSETSACALPGADVGTLALIYSTANSCGFEIDTEKAFRALIEMIGDIKYFSFHTDGRNNTQGKNGPYDLIATGCGHTRSLAKNKEVYSLTDLNLVSLSKQIAYARNNGAVETVLRGDHKEGAVLQIKGEWGVQPQGFYSSERGDIGTQVFVFHFSLVQERLKLLSRLLVARHAVKLSSPLDDEYLYQMISTTAEDHLMSTAVSLAKGMPLYEVVFDEGGSFEVESLGFV